jgi:transposase-like protein
MAARVARRGRRRKARAAKGDGKQQREQQQAVRRQLRAAIARLVQRVVEETLEAEVTALLGREAYARRTTAPQRPTGARCNKCQQDWAPKFARAGSYRRTLLTTDAAVVVRVPRVSCRCGGQVAVPFTTLGRYARSWGELQERARQLAGLCLSLQDTRELLALDNGQPVARSTLNSWVHQAAQWAETLRAGPLPVIPAVLQCDGLWVKVMRPTGEGYQDAGGRQRQRVRRVKVPLLVAYGVDPVRGECWIVDWELGEAEDQASWQRLLERLHTRGLHATAGLTLIVHDGSAGLEAALAEVDFGPGVLQQRCVFHVLCNVREKVQGEPGMSRADKRARRRAVLRAAAPIWQTTDPATAQRRWQTFRETWAAQEPAAVATVAERLTATLGYCAAVARGRERGEAWQATCLRATSALERANRALRQKVRQAGMFHSERGLLAAVALVIAHRGLARQEVPHELWPAVVEAVLAAA